MTDTKPTNPKDSIGSDKLPLHLWPASASAMGCLGLLDGKLKYGRSNFRAIGVRLSIYVDALKRHAEALFEGEDLDPDSGLPHEAHILACAAIIVDARAAGKVNDDRMYPGGYRELVGKLTPHVPRLKALHAGKSPKDYTIADGPGGPINVVAGIMYDPRGRVFLQRRPLMDENFPGRWEVPGGSVERGETDHQALRREFAEECGVSVNELSREPVWEGEISGYGPRRHRFRFYTVLACEGRPRALDGQPEIGFFGVHRAAEEMALTPATMLAWPKVVQLSSAKLHSGGLCQVLKIPDPPPAPPLPKWKMKKLHKMAAEAMERVARAAGVTPLPSSWKARKKKPSKKY